MSLLIIYRDASSKLVGLAASQVSEKRVKITPVTSAGLASPSHLRMMYETDVWELDGTLLCMVFFFIELLYVFVFIAK